MTKSELVPPSTPRASSLATGGTTAPGSGGGSSKWPTAGIALGRYVLRRRIGMGGMGEVWAAHDDELDRDVAIKLVRTRDAAAAGLQFERLAREARALARVSDPHVVQVYDVGTYRHDEATQHGVFVVMELVRGLPLDRWLTLRNPARAEILVAFDAAGRGLAAAHAAGLVHRDVKPSNVFVGDDGRVRVGDFGLARAAEIFGSDQGSALDESQPRAIDETLLGSLTRTGAMAGTPVYMAPEQHAGRTIDARGDQYGFCVALWEALFGVRPFSGAPATLLWAKSSGPPLRPSVGRHVPRSIERVVRRGLAPDPAARWPDMPALLAALRRAAQRDRTRPLVVATALAVAAATTVVLVLDEPASPCPAIEPAAWSDEQHERLQPHGRAAAIVDDYLAEVHRARDRVCERTPAERVGALACLRGAAVQVATTVDLIGRSGRSDVDLDRLVGGLPDVEQCLVAPSESVASTPAEPVVQERIDALERGDTLVRGERFNEALEIAESVLAAIDDGRVPSRPLHARATYLLGKALDGLARGERSEAAYADAYFEAVEQGEHEVAFHSARSLAHSLSQRFEIEDARRWLRHAETEAALLPSTPERVIALATTRGAIAVGTSDFEAAAGHFRDAIATCEAATCTGRALLLLNLAETMERLDRIPEAEIAARESLGLLVETYGVDSPATIRARVELVSLLMHENEFTDAEAELAVVEPLIERWLAPHDSVRPVAFATRGHLAARKGDHAASIVAYEAAMAAMDPSMAPYDMRWVPHLNDLANAYHASGRDEEALRMLVRAHEITQHGAPQSFEHGVIQSSLGALRAQLGDHAGGARDIEAGLALLAPMLGPTHDAVLRGRHNLGAALIEAGRLREAEEVLQTLLDDTRDFPADSEIRVGTTKTLASCRKKLAAASAE